MKMHERIKGTNFQKDPDVSAFFSDKGKAIKYISVYATCYGLRSSEIRIAFDRTSICNDDIVDALSDKRFRNMLEEMRLCGNAFPIKLTEAERLAIFDHKHDEEC